MAARLNGPSSSSQQHQERETLLGRGSEEGRESSQRLTPVLSQPFLFRSPSGELVLGGGDSRGRYSGLAFPPTPIRSSPQVTPEVESPAVSCMRYVLSRTEEALASGNSIERAAAIIDKAIEGPPIPISVLRSPTFPTTIRLFFLHERLAWLWGLALVALVLLLFFEVPPWCRETTNNPCGDPLIIPLGGLPYFPRMSVAIVQGLATAVLVFETYLMVEYSGGMFTNSHRNPLVYLKIFLLACLTIDCSFLAHNGQEDVWHLLGFHIAYYIRIPTVLVFSRSLRVTFLGITRMAWSISDFLALVVGFEVFASWLALHLFHGTVEGELWFPNFQQALLNMFVLLTASSQPDMQIPAYQEWRGSVLFFAFYFVVGLFILMNLLLAVIFESYKEQVAEALVAEDALKRQNLLIAFKLLDEKESDASIEGKQELLPPPSFPEVKVEFRPALTISPEAATAGGAPTPLPPSKPKAPPSRRWLDGDQIFALLRALHKNRILQVREKRPGAICNSIETEKELRITEEEFPTFCGVLITKFPRISREEHWLELLWPEVYHTRTFQAFSSFTSGRHLTAITNYFLILNAFVLFMEGQFYLSNDECGRRPWFVALIVFAILYIVEAVLKIAGRGFQKYWVGYRSRFDFVITIAIVAVFLLSPFSNATHVQLRWIWYLESIRLVRLAAVLSCFRRYKVVARTFLGLIPSLAPLIGCLFCTLCLFCAIGVQLFGGLIYDNNPLLQGTDYLEYNYTSRNFNDFASGMVTLFDLCIMSNWVTYMKAFVSVTGCAWVRAYFITFYIVAVLFLLNLVVAFVLQGFLTQMKEEDLRQSQPPTPRPIQQDIDLIAQPTNPRGMRASASVSDLSYSPVHTPHPHHSSPMASSSSDRRSARLIASILRKELEEARARGSTSYSSPRVMDWSLSVLYPNGLPSPFAGSSI